MVDSGGFALSINPAARWTIGQVRAAIADISADIFVTLDYPPHVSDSSRERCCKIAKSIRNFEILSARFPEKIIMPVVHGRTISEIEHSIKLISDITARPKWVGLGGVVPLLQRRRTLTDWAAGPEAFIAKALALIRREFDGALIHVFGAGGTRSFPAVFACGADSADSIGWRHAAGFGSIFLPLKSQRVIKWDQSKRPPRRCLDLADLVDIERCNCPICRTRVGLDQRLTMLRRSFHNRSIHNAWIVANQFEFWPRSRLELRSLVANGSLGTDWAEALRHAL